MAEDGSWPSIRKHGLLSTEALVGLFGIRGNRARELLEKRRPESVSLQHPRVGTAVVRDQKPLRESALRAALVGMELVDWYKLLNSLVFFWPTQERLLAMLNARAYRDSPHDVLVIDSGRLVGAYADRIALSPINSGATIYNVVPRGTATFQGIGEYDFETSRRRRGRANAIAEVAVPRAVLRIEQFVERVERWKGGRRLGLVWRPK